MKSFLVTRILCALLTATVLRAQDTPVVVRVGYFPNITHSQPLIGKAQGWFEKALAPEARVEWRTFNAGPSAMRSHCGTDSGSLLHARGRAALPLIGYLIEADSNEVSLKNGPLVRRL